MYTWCLPGYLFVVSTAGQWLPETHLLPFCIQSNRDGWMITGLLVCTHMLVHGRVRWVFTSFVFDLDHAEAQWPLSERPFLKKWMTVRIYSKLGFTQKYGLMWNCARSLTFADVHEQKMIHGIRQLSYSSLDCAKPKNPQDYRSARRQSHLDIRICWCTACTSHLTDELLEPSINF